MTEREKELAARRERNLSWLLYYESGESMLSISRRSGFHYQSVRNGVKSALKERDEQVGQELRQDEQGSPDAGGASG